MKDRRPNEQFLDVHNFHAAEAKRQVEIEMFLWRNGISPNDTFRLQIDYTPAGRQRVKVYHYDRVDGKFQVDRKTGELAFSVTTIYNERYEQV